jgi:hypothetical protein
MLRLLITEEEQKLLQDIEDVAFGELFGVQLQQQPASDFAHLSDKAGAMIRFLRSGKRVKLIVHDSEPSMAEYITRAPSGRWCKKRIKF